MGTMLDGGFYHFMCRIQRLARLLGAVLAAAVVEASAAEIHLTFRRGPEPGMVEFAWSQTAASPLAGYAIPNPAWRYALQGSYNLQDWETLAHVAENVSQPEEPLTASVAGETHSHRFYRVAKIAWLPNADLEGLSLAGADFSGANLSRANLAGANLAGANFHQANLRAARFDSADLEGANFSEANLSYATLEGTEVSLGDVSSAVLLNTTLPGGRVVTDDEAAEMLALRRNQDLLPDDVLYQRFRRELKVIYGSFPDLQDATPFDLPPLGRLTIQATPQQLAALEQSEYGPVQIFPPSGRDGLHSVRFQRRYNAEPLAQMLKARNYVQQAWAFTLAVVHLEGEIKLDWDGARYTFLLGAGDCPSGCMFWTRWVISISKDGKPVLEDYFTTGFWP